MAGKKLTDLDYLDLSNINNDDILLILDKSDLTDSPLGTHKKTTFGDLSDKIITSKLNSVIYASYNDGAVGKNIIHNLTITGGIFTHNTTVYSAGMSVNSTTIINSNEILLNVNTATITGLYDIVITNEFGEYTILNGLEVLDIVTLIPDVTTPWYNVSTQLDATPGGIITNNTATQSWTNKGANFGTIPANKDCTLEFNIINVTTGTSYGIIGLTNNIGSYDYTSIDFGINFKLDSDIVIYESGANRGTKTTFVYSDKFKIKRTNGVITYLKNDVVFYTSGVISNTTLEFDCSIFRYLGASNIKITYY